MNSIEEAQRTLAGMAGLTVFSGLKDNPLIRAFRKLLSGVSSGIRPLDLIGDWAAFTGTFIRCGRGCSFYSMVAFLTLSDDNPFTRAAEARDKVPPVLWTLAKNDLSRLGPIAAFDLPGLGAHIAALLEGTADAGPGALIAEEARCLGAAAGEIPPAFPGSAGDARALARIFPENADWGTALPALAEYIRAHGAGELGLHGSFYLKDMVCDASPQRLGGKRHEAPSGDLIRPAANPDRIRLADLAGYEEQRSVVIANTLRFLEGKPANNLLLYGDRGTGKSATVKAVCNEYIHRGLRLMEVRKGDLSRLPAILEFLSPRALRFIVFIDDLSFENTDDSFTGFKALLEGGMEARPANVVIYATSNRRHLVKERLADRPTTAMAAEASAAGDLRAFDTMQEQFSLADRFGLTVIFTSPGQEEYLKIAEFIAEQRGLLAVPGPAAKGGSAGAEVERRLFRENALRWERWFNGRSPRTAVQYVDWLAGGEGFPWE
jgi:predicted AAA+ superfamily ATPase